MLQFVFQTSEGPLAIIGINHENSRRLQAGMPLNIDLKKITPPGLKINRMIIHYGHTYEDVVKDLQEGQFRLPDELREHAKKMDETIAKEKK